MNYRVFFPVSALLTLSVHCQEQPGFVGLGVGLASPMGNFRSTDADNKEAGLATEGVAFDLNFGYRMGKTFGVTAVVRGTGNATSDKAVANSYALQPGQEIKVEPGSWVTAGLYVGVLAVVQMNERWAFTARATVGYASVTSPVLKIGTRDGYLFYKRESAVTGAPAYMLGVGLKGDLGERFCVLLNLDLQGMQADFDEVKVEVDGSLPGKVPYSQSISLVTFAAGLGYRF